MMLIRPETTEALFVAPVRCRRRVSNDHEISRSISSSSLAKGSGRLTKFCNTLNFLLERPSKLSLALTFILFLRRLRHECPTSFLRHDQYIYRIVEQAQYSISSILLDHTESSQLTGKDSLVLTRASVNKRIIKQVLGRLILDLTLCQGKLANSRVKHTSKINGSSLREGIMTGNLHTLLRLFLLATNGRVRFQHLRKHRQQRQAKCVPFPDRSISGLARSAPLDCSTLICRIIRIYPGCFALLAERSKAQRLRSALRIDYNVAPPAISLNESSDGHEPVDEQEPTESRGHRAVNRIASHWFEGCKETYSSTRPWLLLIHLLPLLILYPAQAASFWTVQIWMLSRTRFWSDTENACGRLVNVTLSIIGASLALEMAFPWIGIIAKWTIIGRYKEGLYPMWGPYHTRWWMVQKIVSLYGMGIFRLHPYTTSLYCRLMGAKIGKNVSLTEVVLGEWDLLDIRDDVSLTKCICRPFAVEANTSMSLRRIIIGERASIGVFSVVAPGTEVVADTCIGANSSSWEQKDSAYLSNKTDSAKIKEAHWLLTTLLTWPMYYSAWIISYIPWAAAQMGVLYQTPQDSDVPLRIMIKWYQSSPSVAFHYVAVVARSISGPFLFLFFTVFVRKISELIFGPLTSDTTEREIQGGFARWRLRLTRELFPESELVKVNSLLGQHHQARSWVLRLLGAKVGHRVTWAPMGPFIQDFHLLEIGDFATIGANSQFLTTDEHCSGKITVGKEAVVSDNVCVLPGVGIGRNTILGFGTLTKSGQYYSDQTTYLGCLNGDAARSSMHETRLQPIYDVEKGYGSSYSTSEMKISNNASEETLHGQPETVPEQSPFHQAYYRRNASYKVLTPLATLSFSFFMSAFTVMFWNVPPNSSMKLAARIFVERFRPIDPSLDPIVLYLLVLTSNVVLTTAFALVAIGSVLLAKRCLIGRYCAGIYNWNESSYCQRMQLFKAIERLLYECYVDRGILSLLTGTHWLVLFYRLMGAQIGSDCALFANGSPALTITETDLLRVGDRTVIDDVGIISHLDKRGSIQLGRVKIGDRCVLRSGSNILSGAIMQDDSRLLEHTLILPGHIVEEGKTMYRRPSEVFTNEDW